MRSRTGLPPCLPRGGLIMSNFALDPTIYSVATNYLELLNRRHLGEAPDFHQSGFETLDKEFPGWLHNGHLIVVAGRPGSGKSVFCQQVAEAVARTKTVLFVSFEMSCSELAERAIARRSGVSLPRLRTAKDLLVDDFTSISNALCDFSRLALRVSDEGQTIDALVDRVLQYPGELSALELPSLGLIVVDYLQLIPSSDRRGGGNRALEVGAVSRSLKRLAQDLKVPVLAAAQINRETENRPDKRPGLGDLRESGSIEQDADLVAFLYRDELYNVNSPDKGMVEFLVRKNRHGASGTVKLAFRGENVSFCDLPLPFALAMKPVVPVAALVVPKPAPTIIPGPNAVLAAQAGMSEAEYANY